MIILSIIFLFVVVPLLWAILVMLTEVYSWQLDRGAAKQLSPKFGRDIYEGGPLGARAWTAFKRGYWLVFRWIAGLTALLLLLLIFED